MTNNFEGLYAHSVIPNVIPIPWTEKYVKYNKIRFTGEGLFIHPENAISIHQSQGSTLLISVANSNKFPEKYYGMAKLALSRSYNPESIALASKVT